MTLIRSTEHAAEHEYSCYCHIKQAYVIIQNEKKKPNIQNLIKRQYCTRLFAMKTGMCIRCIDSATDEVELWVCVCQMVNISLCQVYPLLERDSEFHL